MSKFGKELIESMREAREHAEGIRNAPDHGVLLRGRRRTKVTARDMMLREDSLKRRAHCGVGHPHLGEGRVVRTSASTLHSQLRVRVVTVPNVRALRRKLHLSQTEFATKYKIPLATLKNWEQGRRQPDAPASAYLQAIAKRPNEISEALGERLPAS